MKKGLALMLAAALAFSTPAGVIAAEAPAAAQKEAAFSGRSDVLGASSEDLTEKQRQKVYSVLNSKTKITKLTSSGNSINMKWERINVSGVKYQTAIKRIGNNDSWSYKTARNNHYTFSDRRPGYQFGVSVRAYVEVEGENYFGKWSGTKKIRVKLPITSAQVDAAYAKYRSGRGFKGAYKMVDLDNNGVREMLYRDENIMGVYTADPNTAATIRLREVNSGKKGRSVPLYFSKKKHKVFLSSYRTGGSTGWHYVIRDQRAVRIRLFDYTNGSYEPKAYRIDGKSVSKGRYNRELEKCTKKYSKLRFFQGDMY